MEDPAQEEGVRVPRGAGGPLKPPRYRLLATDLDGTLLDANGNVHPRDAAAIAELSKRGIKVTICTGRLYSGTRPTAHVIGVDGPVACMDGSSVFTTRGDRELVRTPIPRASHEPLRDALRSVGAATFVFEADAILHDQTGDEHLDWVSIWSSDVRRVNSVFEAGAWSGQPSALVALGAEQEIRATAELLDAGDLQSVCFATALSANRDLWGMVVRAAGATKASALEWIARYHDVDISEVVAVGDWLNDVPMLREAGRSFAMAQAPEAVKEAADEILDASSATGGGIVEAAERAGLL